MVVVNYSKCQMLVEFSSANKTVVCKRFVCTVDKGLQGQNIVQSVINSATNLLKINLPDIDNVALNLHAINISVVWRDPPNDIRATTYVHHMLIVPSAVHAVDWCPTAGHYASPCTWLCWSKLCTHTYVCGNPFQRGWSRWPIEGEFLVSSCAWCNVEVDKECRVNRSTHNSYTIKVSTRLSICRSWSWWMLLRTMTLKWNHIKPHGRPLLLRLEIRHTVQRYAGEQNHAN